jgi:hypothetical protein
MYLRIYLCIHVSIYVLTYLSMYSRIYLCTHVSIYVLTYLSMYSCIYLCTRVSIYVLAYLSMYSRIYLCTHVSIYVLTYLSMYLRIYLCTHVSIYVLTYLSMYSCIYLCTHVSIYVLTSKHCLSSYIKVVLFISILAKSRSKHFCSKTLWFSGLTENGMLIVSEWLLFNAKWALFHLYLYHGENKLQFDEMIMISALCYNNMLSWVIIVLAHWNNIQWGNMSLLSDTIYWFRASQCLLFLLNAAYLAVKQQIPI